MRSGLTGENPLASSGLPVPIKVSWFVEPALFMLARHASAGDGHDGSVAGSAARSSDEQFEGLVAGEIDVAVTAMDNVMEWNARLDGGDLRIIAQVETTTPLRLVGREGIGELAELAGATILVDAPDNGFAVVARVLLDEQGLNFANYRLKPVGGGFERCEALISGEGDAAVLISPLDSHAVSRGCRVLADLNRQYPDYPGQGLVMRRDSSARSRVARWASRLESARLNACSHRDTAIDKITSMGVPVPIAQGQVGLIPPTLVPDREGIALLIAQRQGAGLRGGNVGHADVVDDQFLHDLKVP